MPLPDFAVLPLWANLIVFVVSAGAVWMGGARLTRFADLLAEQTGMGRAFLGILLLGGITSLPEVAATATASLAGNAPLAVNGLLGGVMMQTTILALADMLVGREAISTIGARSEALLDGVLLIILLTVVGIGMVVGGETLGEAWTFGTLGIMLGGLFLLSRYEHAPRWQPLDRLGLPVPFDRPVAHPSPDVSMRWIVRGIIGVGVLILLAGATVAAVCDALAVQTGVGSSFAGTALLAVATSLPEVSVTVAAIRMGQNQMAFANVFGTNLFDVGLLALADVCYPGPPVLSVVGTPALLSVLFGILLTAIYLAGIIERKDRTVLRMGWDSALVLLLYVVGLVCLYRLI